VNAFDVKVCNKILF